MSSINGLGNAHAAQRATRTAAPPAAPATEKPAGLSGGADRVEINGTAHANALGRSQPGVRADKVAAVRQQIEAGTYETPEKLDRVIDRLLDELA